MSLRFKRLPICFSMGHQYIMTCLIFRHPRILNVWRMFSIRITEHGKHPGFIECNPTLHTITEFPEANVSISNIPVNDLFIYPASKLQLKMKISLNDKRTKNRKYLCTLCMRIACGIMRRQ